MAETIFIDSGNIETTTETLADLIDSIVDRGKRCEITVKESRRKLSQNALFHVWVSQISRHLTAKGKAYCTPEWVKRQLKGSFLGTESIESVCLLTGDKSVTEEVRSSSKLDKGEFNFFLNRIQEWSVDTGLILSAPIDSTYTELNNRQVQ